MAGQRRHPYAHTIPLTSATSPAYLQIVRYTDTSASPPVTYFSTLTSTDGSTWTPVLGSSVALDMGSGSYLAGLAATTGTTGATTPATFGSVSLAAVTTPPQNDLRERLHLRATSAVPGSRPATSSIATAPGRMQASGDIWSVYDEFRYADQSFPATRARPTATAHSAPGSSRRPAAGPWMRSGVMIRSGPTRRRPTTGCSPPRRTA